MCIRSGMSWPDIKAAVENSGKTLSQLAAENGLTRWAMTKVNYHSLQRPQKLIADAIGIPACEIWPDRYDENGRFIDRRKKNYRTRSMTCTRKGSRAA